MVKPLGPERASPTKRIIELFTQLYSDYFVFVSFKNPAFCSGNSSLKMNEFLREVFMSIIRTFVNLDVFIFLDVLLDVTVE